MATFNRANLLSRSIGSVIGQIYQDWELIIWDDGSTDNTCEVITSFKDGRIKYFFEDNHGAAYARNRAVERAQGELIAFLDSDDEWRTNKLSDQVEVMQAHREIEVLFTDFDNINEVIGKTSRNFDQCAKAMRCLVEEKLAPDVFLIQDGMLKGLATANFIATDTLMLHKEVFIRMGGFSEKLRNSEDFELWWRMALADTQFAYLNRVTMTRYKPADSLSSISLPMLENHLKAIETCKHQALSSCHEEVVPLLNLSVRNAWMNMIPLHGEKGDNRAIYSAFLQSLRYGVSLGAIRLLLSSTIFQKCKS